MEKEEKVIPQIKICGLTRTEEAAYLNQIQAEYAGFVFWEKSKRNVDFVQAEEICHCLDKNITRVAVTVSPNIKLLRQIEQAGFDILQVHGELHEEILEKSRIPIWQACNLKEPEDIEKLRRDSKIVGYVMDAATAGGGKTFDWAAGRQILEKMRTAIMAGKTLVLAGGLNPQNIEDAVQIFSPDVVDVSSGVEGVCGKEKALILEFAAKARAKSYCNYSEPQATDMPAKLSFASNEASVCG